jgi:hypothetical protein
MEIEPKTHAQQKTAFQHTPGDSRVANGGADSAQEDRVETAQGLECRLVEHKAITQISSGTQFEVRGREDYPGRSHDVEGGLGNLGSNAVAAEHGHAIRALVTHDLGPLWYS